MPAQDFQITTWAERKQVENQKLQPTLKLFDESSCKSCNRKASEWKFINVNFLIEWQSEENIFPQVTSSQSLHCQMNARTEISNENF